MIPPLVASSFFTTYPALLVQRWAIENKIGYLVHNTSKYLKLAVEKYFSSVFKSHKVDLVDKPKNKEGVQVNALSPPNYSDLVGCVCVRQEYFWESSQFLLREDVG